MGLCIQLYGPKLVAMETVIASTQGVPNFGIVMGLFAECAVESEWQWL